MELPKMKSMRLDIVEINGINYSLLVNQETNGIYFVEVYNHKNTLKSLYADFKYAALEMRKFTFYIPLGLRDRLINLNNLDRYANIKYLN